MDAKPTGTPPIDAHATAAAAAAAAVIAAPSTAHEFGEWLHIGGTATAGNPSDLNASAKNKASSIKAGTDTDTGAGTGTRTGTSSTAEGAISRGTGAGSVHAIIGAVAGAVLLLVCLMVAVRRITIDSTPHPLFFLFFGARSEMQM